MHRLLRPTTTRPGLLLTAIQVPRHALPTSVVRQLHSNFLRASCASAAPHCRWALLRPGTSRSSRVLPRLPLPPPSRLHTFSMDTRRFLDQWVVQDVSYSTRDLLLYNPHLLFLPTRTPPLFPSPSPSPSASPQTQTRKSSIVLSIYLALERKIHCALPYLPQVTSIAPFYVSYSIDAITPYTAANAAMLLALAVPNNSLSTRTTSYSKRSPPIHLFSVLRGTFVVLCPSSP